LYRTSFYPCGSVVTFAAFVHSSFRQQQQESGCSLMTIAVSNRIAVIVHARTGLTVSWRQTILRLLQADLF
jgi:hypothetical protein